MSNPQPPQDPRRPAPPSPGQGTFPQPDGGPHTPPAGWEHAPFPPSGPPPRPGTVLAAAVMTYVGGGLMILLGLVMVLGAADADFRESFAEGAGAPDPGTGTVAGFGISAAVFGIVLVILAALAQRGRNGARIALTVIGGVVMLLQLISLATGVPQALLGFLWIALAVTLFWAGNANAWYRQVRT